MPPSESIGRILDTDTEPVSDQASLEELARVLATYDLTIIPIVNESHRLVGR
ncbi:Mg/Co/Ni transporter MgtE [Rothia aeria]|uniref:Mg/Co/Ni transporter MgtE n=1 Tax=Rothia aeria TaxID=172042 RepID=A0A2Z5R248_9MICC|nr:Mg/Co/Ni transporter MgtE [Rothia aeria]